MMLLAQGHVEISCDADMPICSETSVTLSVPNDYLQTYLWTPGGATTNAITVAPFESITYTVYVMDTAGCGIDTASILLDVLPRFQTEMTQLKLTCNNNDADNGKTAQVMAVATGMDEPYTYEWENISPLHIAPTNPAVAIGLQARKWYYVRITDARGCSQRDSIFTQAYPTPVIEIYCDPSDTVYIQNPDVRFSFENESQDSINVDHFFWTFNEQYGLTSTQDEPVFTYVETGEFQPSLTVYDDFGCDTIFLKSVKVNPVKLKIPNVFTPNGDGINDYFVITLDGGGGTTGGDNGGNGSIRGNDEETPLNVYYKSTDLMVMNRWGRVVYHSNDYQNDWDGGDLPDATYFYVLKCKGLKEEIQYQGSVMILGSGR